MVCPQPGATNKAGETNPGLPRSFIQLEAKNRHNVDCTSHELNALNSRLKDATNDCMVLTEQVRSKAANFCLLERLNRRQLCWTPTAHLPSRSACYHVTACLHRHDTCTVFPINVYSMCQTTEVM